jgi:hypothetical protein
MFVVLSARAIIASRFLTIFDMKTAILGQDQQYFSEKAWTFTLKIKYI